MTGAGASAAAAIRRLRVVGGGTGLIGDPSGKTTERQLLTVEQVEENVEGIRAQLARFLDFEQHHSIRRASSTTLTG